MKLRWRRERAGCALPFYVKEREEGGGLSQIKTPGSFFTGIIALHVVNGVIFWYLKLWQGSSRHDLLAAVNAGKATGRRKGRRARQRGNHKPNAGWSAGRFLTSKEETERCYFQGISLSLSLSLSHLTVSVSAQRERKFWKAVGEKNVDSFSHR